jgi:hypothetical protein
MLTSTALQQAAKDLATPSFDRIETIDEPLVDAAATLREHFGVAGLSASTARLCRDKVAMKEFLRKHDIPCAQSAAVASSAEALAFAERCGYPVITKPIAGFGTLRTFRCADAAELERALTTLQPSATHRVAIEEFVEGHEGFFDSLSDAAGVRHEFAAHYYPGCLEAAQHRWISPQIAVTNRIEQGGYEELRALNRRVLAALGIRDAATHMEWFFGPKGLKFSEIGCRPPGVRAWDLYNVGNDMDLYREWAMLIGAGRPSQRPSRRLSAGMIALRPDRDGRIAGYEGLDAVRKAFFPHFIDWHLPPEGTPTQPVEAGYMANAWIRMKHENYDELRRMLDLVGQTVRTRAQ